MTTNGIEIRLIANPSGFLGPAIEWRKKEITTAGDLTSNFHRVSCSGYAITDTPLLPRQGEKVK
jgi:hypothetical protein